MKLVFAALAAVPFSCGPLLEADLALPEWCQNMDRKEVPAAPPDLPPEAEFSGLWGLPPLPVPEGGNAGAEVELVRIELNAQGIDSLGFLTAASIVADPEGAAVVIADLGDLSVNGTQAVLLPPTQQELTSLFAGGELPVVTRLAGELPDVPWTVDIKACFRSKANVAYDPFAPAPAGAR